MADLSLALLVLLIPASPRENLLTLPLSTYYGMENKHRSLFFKLQTIQQVLQVSLPERKVSPNPVVHDQTLMSFNEAWCLCGQQ